MSKKFIVTHKSIEKFVIMTLRIEKDLQEEFDKLASKSDRSRNELMCMALKYALEQLEFTAINENSDKNV
ncbi:ribbon-helix-helix protein, CopG family [Clostridium sp. MD294]|uniref:ribbon-helix-helix protein, CopG family n=1 Tax=Clostridium sp. MD294 TaxID=97138 RepID=UPI0002C98E6B|nr:ribbon-helix-helix protein, CopG family [Clostridium sp. MD294]NDO46229.1 CopG family transcriptional regulator [Clostridium sp. MD294]USF30102.1 hypothetical protein C820_001543 [Clostridium sp. MD294]